MQLEQLAFVVEVSKTGSLTAAAQNMHVTLSAVSQSISNLEEELGVTLFIRSRMGATPTPEGRPLIRKAYQIIELSNELREEASGYTNKQVGHLRLAAFPGPLHLAMDAILDFKQNYPYIQLDITEKGIDQIIEDVRQGKIDIGLITLSEYDNPKQAGLKFGQLLEGKMVLAVNRQSPLALYESITLDELKREPLIIYNEEHLKWFMDKHQESFDLSNVLFYTNNTSAIMKAIRDGMASTIGLNLSFINEPAINNGDIVLVELELPDPYSIYLGWVRSEGRHLPKATELFIKKLKHRLSEYEK
ncbi:LysR family transcriptional regulator [Paenibacillus albiflavus]|uniref:LysR family transcriptional regulator n=1 Tax=Paenibacillus albiflavus TaxID=2545760 RepID=A0A4R4EEZ5_9BACL|nr:LysR family transcriptional regulator [Paenibacillus albiflavus]TCZ76648.1 LysR family transcriptional regulator [Paenibacillus albiflavus]